MPILPSPAAPASRPGDPDPVVDAVDRLMVIAADQSRLIAQLALVIDALVAERLGDPAPDEGELEIRWADLAALLTAHARTLRIEEPDDRAAPR